MVFLPSLFDIVKFTTAFYKIFVVYIWIFFFYAHSNIRNSVNTAIIHVTDLFDIDISFNYICGTIIDICDIFNLYKTSHIPNIRFFLLLLLLLPYDCVSTTVCTKYYPKWWTIVLTQSYSIFHFNAILLCVRSFRYTINISRERPP